MQPTPQMTLPPCRTVHGGKARPVREECAVEVDGEHLLPLRKLNSSSGCTIWMPALLISIRYA